MTTRPRIPRVLLIRNAKSYDFGGAERYPVDLAKELAANGWNSLVVSRNQKLLDYAKTRHTPHERGLWWDNQDWNGWRALLVPIYVVWQLILTIWYMRLISRYGADVVHPQSKDDFIAATVAAKLLGRRVVWTDHADLKYIYANHAVWYKNPVGKLVHRASKLADYIAVVSQNERTLIARALGESLDAKYVVVHNGVNEKMLKPAKVAKKPRGTFVFCATSRLVTAKGIGELITAFQEFSETHEKSELWLVGDGPEHIKFKHMAADIPGVKLLGHSDNPLSFAAAADVFVHPSYHEGFSLSLVEAAMLGKPIIACSVGGNTEIIRDRQTGLLVSARNSAALHNAMEKLYDNPKLAATLGKNARALYENNFRFDRLVTEKLLPLYGDYESEAVHA
jgi:glycosyltransferase involved in cell wall biosynthesis